MAQTNSEVITLFETVVNGGYCIGCGACAAVVDSPITMVSDEYGRIVATMDSAAIDDSSASVLAVCPFSEVGPNEDEISQELFAKDCYYKVPIGYYLATYAGFVAEDDFREQGSSGGLTTWFLCELLEQNLIDGVIHVREFGPKEGDSNLFRFCVSRSIDEIRMGAKSRYYPIEMSQALTLIRRQPGRYAVVGIPCFIKAIRLLSREDQIIHDRVRFCVGLLCGHLKSTRFAEMLAWQCGLKPNDVISIDFRKKLYDRDANKYGVEVVGDKGKKKVKVVRPMQMLSGHNWGHGFFKYKACDFCDDIFAETADIVIGDAWLPRYVKDSAGTNVVIIRDPLLGDIIERAISASRLHLESIETECVAKTQDSSLRHRRNGLAYRLHLMDNERVWRPPKRVQPKSTHLNEKLKKIYRLRMQIAIKSHLAFQEALKQDSFAVFINAMYPLIEAYETVHRNIAQGPWWRGWRTKLDVLYRQKFLPLLLSRGLFINRLMFFIEKRRKSLQPRKIKEKVLTSLLLLYVLFLRLKRYIFFDDSSSSVLLVPPAAPGSLGDEATVTATVGYLNQRNVSKIGLISYDSTLSWRNLDPIGETIELTYPIPDSALRDKFRFDCAFAQAAGRYKQIYLLGADMLDGYYSDHDTLLRLSLVSLATRTGANVTVVGSSLNAKPTPASVKALRQLSPKVKFYARDEISQQRLTQLLHRQIGLVTDVAFLLVSRHNTEFVDNIRQWLSNSKLMNRTVIGINAHPGLVRNLDKQIQENFVQYYVNALIELYNQNEQISFLLLPHDFRPYNEEVSAVKAISERLPAEIQTRSQAILTPYSAVELKAICGDLDFVLSGRMHLAIACLGQSTPVACITYQDKFEGLFQHFELEGMLINPTEAFQPGKLAAFLQPLISKREEIRQHIQLKLPRVHRLAQANFEQLN